MTVTIGSEINVHHPRIYISDATNIVSLYTLSHLVRSEDEYHIYFQAEADNDKELVKRICPRAINETVPFAKGMERSVLYLREEMDENELKGPVQGYHRFVLIVSMATGNVNSIFNHLENVAKTSGYQSSCLLRLAPIYQNFELINPDSLNFDGDFFGIDAEDVGSAISHILLDPELHQGEEYTIYYPAEISLSKVKAVHSQLPKIRGNHIQSAESILSVIKANLWDPSSSSLLQNDFRRITGGEEMTSFEEFLRKSNQSLFHQRFVVRE